MRVGVAFIVCLSGCHALFGLDEVTVPPGPDAAPDAPLPVMGCTPASMLHEDFDDTTKTLWFPTVSGSGTQTFEGGALRVEIMAMDAYYSIIGERFYDMRDDQFTFEMTDAGLDAESSIEVRIDGDPRQLSWLQFFRMGTTLMLRRATGNGAAMQLASVPYVAANHRFLRFKSSGTQIVFQASGNGTDYVDLLTAFDIDWAATVSPGLRLHRGANGTMFDASLHSVHGGTSMVGACPIRELADTFEGDAVTPLWKRSTAYSSGTVSQSAGAIELANMPSVTLGGGLRPLGLYDLTNASTTIDIEQMFETTQGMWFEFGFRGFAGRAEIMKQEMGILTVERYDGSVAATKPYVAADHRFWRFTESAGNITWATSGDGITFASMAETTGHVGLDRADLYMHGNGTSSVQTSVRISSITGADAP